MSELFKALVYWNVPIFCLNCIAWRLLFQESIARLPAFGHSMLWVE